MPPRTIVSAFSRSIAFRPKPQIQWPARSSLRVAPTQSRTYADAQDRSHNPKSEPIEHVSEEAAKTAQIMGEEGPDVNQGTPVEDVSMERDESYSIELTTASWSRATRKRRRTYPRSCRMLLSRATRLPPPRARAPTLP